jgi:hypothetical protein
MDDATSEKGRKGGSSSLAGATGVVLVILAILMFGNQINHQTVKDHHAAINGGSSLLFGTVLLWWALTGKKGRHKYGIGFETVTMIFAVVTAVIAILTLTGQ